MSMAVRFLPEMTTSELPAMKNPKNWRFTWESNSHVPILRLYLFNLNIRPSSQCTHLKVSILFEKSLLQVTWLWLDQNEQPTPALWVPIPRVLIDVDSPINVRALDDHIELKFLLILPVDHPIVSNFDFEAGDNNALEDDGFQPLHLDSDLKKLTSCGEVHFYCKGCSTKLTRALRIFREMPSVNWREAADNWFGTCCCSFGGASEKLVAKYANAYTCSSGVCLLDATSVVLCKDDFVGYKFPDQVEVQESRSSELLDCNGSAFKKLQLIEDAEGTSESSAVVINNSKDHDVECCHRHVNDEEKPDTNALLANKASFLNGLLGNSFMVTSPYLSNDIKWREILCPNCSCLLGAYPHDNVDVTSYDFNTAAPLNDEVHLFKCFISTCLPAEGSTDMFRKYTLERMFTSQLLESAKDELSFRTVVRNLQKRSPMLQIVLLNPNSWCSSGDCMDAMLPIPIFNMYPTIKVLFSDCSNSTESQLRKLDQWATTNQVSDIYMLTSKAIIESLELANHMLPPSHAYYQGLALSFLRR